MRGSSTTSSTSPASKPERPSPAVAGPRSRNLIRASLEELGAQEGEFSLSIDRDLPLVSVDPVQIERAFVNVLENARRHSGGHPVSVRARAVRGLARLPAPALAGSGGGAIEEAEEPPAGGRVVVRIVDRGPGIPPAQRERVFEPFYRAGTPGGDRRGSGLGLSIARGFTEANAGTLHVESLPGQGATFVFDLPSPSPHRGPERWARKGDRRSRRECSSSMTSPRILRALKVVLREAGFEVLPAETAAHALDLAAVDPASAAIVDLVLPDGDGVEVTRRLREWSEMPILVLSAVGEEDEKVRALEAGADDYITKPFGARELIARLQAALRRTSLVEGEPAVAVDGLEIDFAAHLVRRDGREVHLTPIEFDLLATLVRNRGRLLTHRALLADVWGPGYVEDIQTLRTHIARLRAKIEPAGDPRYIVTDPGVGYRFAA